MYISCNIKIPFIFHVHTVELVREKVQLNWPDAETGIAREEQNRACTVLSNYVDQGKRICILHSIWISNE